MGRISIIIVDDNRELVRLLGGQLKDLGYDVKTFTSGSRALEYSKKNEFDVAVLDIKMPEMDGLTLLKKIKAIRPFSEIIMLTGFGSVETAVEAMKLGAYDYLTKPMKISELSALLEKAYDKKRLADDKIVLRKEVDRLGRYSEIIGESRQITEIKRILKKVSASKSPVLIQGESGTGKELIAREIHRAGQAGSRPFIVVDCSTLQENLLENELFGHEKGAFTDAQSVKKGLIEQADGGVLFLDEIAEMSKSLQAKLLRVLETNVFRRLGSISEIRVDVRLICATNKDLAQEVRKNNFREDLYYRLNVFSVTLPPLRERKEDIPALARHFIETSGKAAGKGISPACYQALKGYDWPGNVRELFNTLERALILSENKIILPGDLRFSGPRPGPEPDGIEQDTLLLGKMLENAEKKHISRVLEAARYGRKMAAEMLGISRLQLYRKMKKHGLSGG